MKTRKLVVLSMLYSCSLLGAQTGAAPSGTAGQNQSPAAAPAPASGRGLQLQTLDPSTRTDPFPAVDPKNFTAASPTAAEVDSYLHAVLGYDAGRIWRVMAIQKTAAPGVSKVVAMVSSRMAGSKVQTAVFFVMPDGKHSVADSSGVSPFGANPFAETREMLKARAEGPARGAATKDLMLVEFADLQCPKCKDAQETMARLEKDFPKARIVYENYPLTDVHPMAFQAAAFGSCVTQENSAAYLPYAQAVYEHQSALTPDAGEQTLKSAAAKAGVNAEKVAACAKTPQAKEAVEATLRLGADVGVEQTPTLAVNGRLLPLTAVPYETLKSLIVFQAGLDGVAGAAISPTGTGISPQRQAPTLTPR